MGAVSQDAQEPRRFLIEAAGALEETLRRNDHKPDWAAYPRGFVAHLDDLLSEELAELREVLFSGNMAEIRHEALDVALVALLIWHQAGGSDTRNRGREY